MRTTCDRLSDVRLAVFEVLHGTADHARLLALIDAGRESAAEDEARFAALVVEVGRLRAENEWQLDVIRTVVDAVDLFVSPSRVGSP